MTRDPGIKLDPAHWRCSSDKCGKRFLCARRLAAIPKGAPLQDGLLSGALVHPLYSLHHNDCLQFMEIKR
jgi:hypothetical protein